MTSSKREIIGKYGNRYYGEAKNLAWDKVGDNISPCEECYWPVYRDEPCNNCGAKPNTTNILWIRTPTNKWPSQKDQFIPLGF